MSLTGKLANLTLNFVGVQGQDLCFPNFSNSANQLETSLRLGYDLFQVFYEIVSFLIFWRSIIFVGIVGYLWYYFFRRPFNRYRDMTELGYDEANTREGGNNVARMNFINDMRKARKVGVATALYPNGWFVIMESRFLKKNEAKEANYFGKTFVVWRGSSGQAYIADGYCPHIGAHLGVMGLVKGECIECPFHGWTFEGKVGKCVKIPYADPSSIPDNAKLKLHTSIEMNGFIFIWQHDQGHEPTWTPRRIKEIEDGAWKYRGRSEFRVSVHAQEVAENIADTGHFAKLHETSYFAKLNFNNRMLDFIFDQEWKTGWYVSKEENRGHESFMEAAIIHKIFKQTVLDTSFLGRSEGPGITAFLSELFGPSAFFLMVTPIGPFETRMIKHMYSKPTLLAHPFALAVLYVESMQIDRDCEIWNRKTRWGSPMLIKEDKLVKMQRRWYAQFYSKPSEITWDVTDEKKLDEEIM